ncbi:MAG: hypothetical protein V4509_00445 [Patescibacteria group bacterium]
MMLDKDSAQATSQNEVLAKDTGGVVVPATSATVRSEVEGICNQDISTADALTQVPAIQIFEGDTFIADTTNNTDAADNYQRMVLTDSKHVNNTGTDDPDGIVEQVEPYGEPADKKAIFKFV